MAQFDLHRNLHETTAERYPLLADIQDNLLSSLATRVVIPLVRQEGQRYEIMWNLVPELTVDGERYVMLVPQFTHVRAEQLGPVARTLDGSEQYCVLSSGEMLFRGL